MIPDVTPNGVFYLPPTGWLTSFYNPPFYLILEDHKIIGSIFGATSFLTLVGSFIGNINELSGNDDISKQKQNKK